jgi:hypothetical protein
VNAPYAAKLAGIDVGRFVKPLHEAGVRLIAGTDAGIDNTFELPGLVVERNLGIAFGLVVRAMGFSKTAGGGISSLRQGEVSQFTVVLEDTHRGCACGVIPRFTMP